MASKKPAKNSKKKSPPKPQFVQAFPTNFVLKDFDDTKLNERLRASIWRERALDPEGIYRSNKSGTWHSKDDLLDKLGDDGITLKRMFGQAMVEWGTLLGLDPENDISMKLQAWAMVYSDRGYAAAHTHPNCHVSAVYYVDSTLSEQEQELATGVSVRPGDIEFIDTRRGGEQQLPFMRMNPGFIVPYQSGRMAVFPSWLPHYVHPVVGPGERISIACNGTFLSSTPKENL